jgi:hypothetical protein
VPELHRAHESLWFCEQPLRFMGAEVGARMAVVKLSTGGVLLYSPVRATPEVRREVDAIGPVEHVIAPNKFHHLFAGDWSSAYSGSKLWIAPGLHKKRKDLSHGSVLDDAPAPWAVDVAHVPMRGQPLLNETVLFHKPSRTLICADAIHNVGAEKPLSSKVFYSLVGGYGGFKTNLLDKLATRDKPALRESWSRVLSFDIERVAMAHGVVLETNGRESLRRAYHWLGV